MIYIWGIWTWLLIVCNISSISYWIEYRNNFKLNVNVVETMVSFLDNKYFACRVVVALSGIESNHIYKTSQQSSSHYWLQYLYIHFFSACHVLRREDAVSHLYVLPYVFNQPYIFYNGYLLIYFYFIFFISPYFLSHYL